MPLLANNRRANVIDRQGGHRQPSGKYPKYPLTTSSGILGDLRSSSRHLRQPSENFVNYGNLMKSSGQVGNFRQFSSHLESLDQFPNSLR